MQENSHGGTESRAKLTGQESLSQKPRKCLQTHEDAVLTCGGMFPGGLVRNTTLSYVPAEPTKPGTS